MSKIPKLRFKFFLCVTSLLVLGGCGAATSIKESVKNATRPSKVEQKHASVDMSGLSPLEQHMRARGMVNPADTSEMHAYSLNMASAAQIKAPKTMVKPSKKPRNVSAPVRHASLDRAKITRRAVAPPTAKPRAPVEFKTAVKPVVKRAVTPAAKVAHAGGAMVTGVRIGQHGDKTRIVLDVSAAADFDYQMDSDKNVLVIQLSNVGWETEAKRVFAAHPLLLAYLAKPSAGGGTFLAVKMKRKAALVFKTSYPPNGTSGHRIVFDIAPA